MLFFFNSFDSFSLSLNLSHRLRFFSSRALTPVVAAPATAFPTDCAALAIPEPTF
jgi:hypothetical protein